MWPFHRRARSCGLAESSGREEEGVAKRLQPVPNYAWRGCGIIRTASWNSEERNQDLDILAVHSPSSTGSVYAPDPEDDSSSGDVLEDVQEDTEGANCRKASSVDSGEDDWTSNPEFFTSGSSGSIPQIAVMDFPLRTVDRHLAELGKKALHKGLFLPSDDITLAGVRITGEQGQVWSSNPIFTTADETEVPSSPESSLCQDCDIPHACCENGSSLFLDDEWNFSEEDNREEENKTNKSCFHSLTFEVPAGGGVAPGALETVDFEVYTVETPKFVVAGAQNADDKGENYENRLEHMEDHGVQTDDIFGRIFGLDMQGGHCTSAASCNSAGDLTQLRKLQEMIEGKDREILDLFGFLSSELQGFPERVSEGMHEIRTLQTMIEQKDLEIADLYSKMSQEVQQAMNARTSKPCSKPEGLSVKPHDGKFSPSTSGACINSAPVAPFAPGHAPSSSLDEQEHQPAFEARSNLCKLHLVKMASASEYPSPPSTPGSSKAPCSSAMLRMMSGSDYYEAELDCAAANVAYVDLVNRIKALEEDLKNKEMAITQKDAVIEELLRSERQNEVSGWASEVKAAARDTRSNSWKDVAWRSTQGRNSSGTVQPDQQVVQLAGNPPIEHNPPWDSARDESKAGRLGNQKDQSGLFEAWGAIKKTESRFPRLFSKRRGKILLH